MGPFFFIDENNDWCRATVQKLGPVNTIAQQLAAGAPTIVKNALPSGTVTMKDNRAHVSMRLAELRLDTYYQMHEGEFQLSFNRQHRRLSPVFRFPEEMHAGFLMSAQFSERRWYHFKSYFFVFVDNRSYYVPLPNIHTDSMVCMGYDSNPSASSLEELAQRVKADFQANTWNADLLGDRLGRAQRMFRCDVNGEPLPVPVNTDLLYPVSHPSIDLYDRGA